jgi:hypothetical protein
MDIRTVYFAAIAALGLLGCGPRDVDPVFTSDAERCVAEPGEGGVVEAREVELGLGGVNAFRAFQDGEETEIVRGFQGGYMITPTVRVEAAGDTREEACFRVHFANVLVEGGEVGPGTLSQVMFTQSGEFFYVDALFDLLGYDLGDLEEKTLLLSATVSGVGFEGKRDVTLRLK